MTAAATVSELHRSDDLTKPALRDAGIDALRGVSILLVVLHHLGLRIPLRKTWLGEHVPRRILSALNFNGYEAVFVFFVISGFLITQHALRRLGPLATLDRLDVKAFYARRVARIVPSLLVVVLALSLLHLAKAPDYLIDKPAQSLPRAIFAALGMHLNLYEGRTGYLPGGWDVLWSLSIEETFYLAFPLAFLLARRTWILVPLMVLFALTLPVTHAALEANEIWQEKAYLPGMAAIATGVLGGIASLARPTAWPRWNVHLLGWTGTLGLSSVFLFEDVLWPVLKDATLLVLTFSSLALLLACDQAHRFPAAPRKRLRPLGWLRDRIGEWGRRSYEIYLTHMFVVFGVVRLFRATGEDMKLGVLWYIPALGFTWMLGAAFERAFSTPCDAWLKARLLKARELVSRPAAPVQRTTS